MSEAPILFAVKDGVATLTLNRPKAGNAITLSIAQALAEHAAQCENDEGISCVVLTGAGRLFCAGGDLTLFREAGEDIGETLRELADTLHGALLIFARMAKPMLVLVNGPAAGAGLSLALSGDIVLCARSAHFQSAYGTLGLTPDGGMSWRLPRLVGLRRAQEIILTNRRIDAPEAALIGMVTRVVDDAMLAEEGLAVARQFAAGSTPALGASRRLLHDSLEYSLEAHLQKETAAIVAAAMTPEARSRLDMIAGKNGAP